MLKSINLWAFPYPERMTLRECLQLAKDAGFDGIKLLPDLILLSNSVLACSCGLLASHLLFSHDGGQT